MDFEQSFVNFLLSCYCHDIEIISISVNDMSKFTSLLHDKGYYIKDGKAYYVFETCKSGVLELRESNGEEEGTRQ